MTHIDITRGRILIIEHESEWRRLCREHNATRVFSMDADVFGAIWFETPNFGWLLSARNAEGRRHIIAKF